MNEKLFLEDEKFPAAKFDSAKEKIAAKIPATIFQVAKLDKAKISCTEI